MKTEDLYLNHAGTSWPKPAVVSEAVQEAMHASPAQWTPRFETAHQAIAEFFGVSRCEQILVTPGCTSALAIGIGDAFIAKGERVLTSRWEHHALHRPLLKLASKGVQVDHIPLGRSHPPDGLASPIDLDWLEQELAKNDVGLVAITAACNVTGELLPYHDVIRLAHQHGAMVLIDAAQIVGWQRLDLPRLGADMVAFGGHKGLQGPWGIGGLYLSDRAQMECTSASCEVIVSENSTVADKSNRKPSSRPGYCDVGSVDQVALAGLHAAVQMLSQQNAEAYLAKGRGQIQRLRASLEPIDHLRIFGAADPTGAMPTLAFSVSGISSSELAARFKRQGIIAGSGFQCAPLAHEALGTHDSGLVRLSVGLGQPDNEIDEAIDRLRSSFDEK